jgi:hypothetical protein
VRRAVPLAAATFAVTGFVVLRPAGPPPSGACAQVPNPVAPRIDCEAERTEQRQSCRAAVTNFRSVRARPRGSRVRLSFVRAVDRPVRVELFQTSSGRVVIGQRRVARRTVSRSPVTLRARRDGFYFARVRLADRGGRADVRRIALERRRGRLRLRRDFQRRESCATLTSFKLERPVFGGRRNRALGISFRVRSEGRVVVEVRRRGRLVRRLTAGSRRSGITHRLRLGSERIGRGEVEVRLVFTGQNGSFRASLYSVRL